MKLKINGMLATAVVAFCTFNTAHAGLVVTSNTNANTLANAILGSGVSISNAVYSGNTGANGSGTFTGGNSAGVGFDSGILLTTGTVQNAVGPNNSTGTTGSGSTSQLDFDFTVTNGNIFFNYVFASEEYNEYVGSQFNDLFKLFVDNVNIALVPSSLAEVTINNVNLGSNSSFFKNNSPGPYDMQYDGLTTVLTASATGLSAGVHKMQFLIQDVGDSSLDSGVFIQAGTFSDTNPNKVPEPTTLALLGLGMAGLGLGRRKSA